VGVLAKNAGAMEHRWRARNYARACPLASGARNGSYRWWGGDLDQEGWLLSGWVASDLKKGYKAMFIVS